MPVADDDPLRDFPDRAIRQTLRHPEHLRDLLRQAVPDLVDAERDPLVAETVASQADQERKKEIQTMTSKWGPTLYEKALAQGKAEGEAKGQLLMARANLRALVENRFGAIPEALAQRIEATADLDRLQAALVQVLHVQSADELLV